LQGRLDNCFSLLLIKHDRKSVTNLGLYTVDYYRLTYRGILVSTAKNNLPPDQDIPETQINKNVISIDHKHSSQAG